MKKSELIDILLSNDEEDVVIMVDGLACEISTEIEHVPESFDGFCTYNEPSLGLIPKHGGEW